MTSIRSIFRPTSDKVIVSADFSQIELRILAHFSQDTTMLNVYHNNGDIHAETFKEIFGLPLSEMTPNRRTVSKSVNFGISYGLTGYGLQRRLKVDAGIELSRKEADEYVERYFRKYPGVRAFIEAIKAFILANGYVMDFFGRRRYFSLPATRQQKVLEEIHRQGVNTVVQGTAASVLKMQMSKIYRCIRDYSCVKMIMTIHDELVFEVDKDAAMWLVRLLYKEMPVLDVFSVPITVAVKMGPSFGELVEVVEE